MPELPSALNPEAMIAHGDFIRALARTLIRDPERAEDLAQDAWVAALEAAPRAAPVASPRAWLAGVTRNLARRSFRDGARQRRREPKGARPEVVRSTQEIVEQEAIRRKVIDAVLALPEPYRTAITFRFYDELPPRKIAKRLGVPVDTVNSRIQRGLRALRKHLDSLHDGDRRAWCLALLPLAGLKLTAGGVIVGASSWTLLATAKAKGAAAAAVVLAALLSAWWMGLFERTGDTERATPPPVEGAAVVDTDSAGAARASSDETDGDVSGEHPSLVLVGRVVRADGEPLPPDLTIAAATKMPPFSFIPIPAKKPAEAIACVHEGDCAPELAATAVHPAADGTFRLAGLPEAEVYLHTLHPFLRVRASDPLRGVDTTTADPVPREIVLETGGVVEGVVLTPQGRSVPSIEVTLRDETLPLGALSSVITKRESFTPLTVTTSRDGSFRFERVPAGRRVVIEVKAEGWAPSFAERVVASPGRSIHVPVFLRRAGSLSGCVVDREGEPRVGIEVRLQSSTVAITAVPTRRAATTDEQGRFGFDGVSPGSYALHLAGPGFFQRSVEELTVAAGEWIRDVRLAVGAGLCIAGEVVDGEGEPVAGATVALARSLVMSQLSEMVTDTLMDARTRCDDAGRFLFCGLREGSYDLTVEAEGFAPTKVPRIVAGAEGIAVGIGRGGSIRGTVRSARDGAPVAAVSISIREASDAASDRTLFDLAADLPSERTATSDVEGNFAIDTLPAGAYDLEFEAPGHGRGKVPGLVVQEGASVEGVEVILPLEASLSGRVIDAATGRPIEGVAIAEKEPGFAGRFHEILGKPTVFTDAEGRFRFGGLAAGTVHLAASHPDYAEQWLDEMVVAEGEAVRGIEIRLERGGVIRGTVRTPDGTAAPGMVLVCMNMTGAVNRIAVVDADGRYAFPGLDDGTHSVLLLPADFAIGGPDFVTSLLASDGIRVVQVEKNRVHEADFVVKARESSGAEVLGFVHEDGQPVGDAIVVFQLEGTRFGDGPRLVGTTGEDGGYRIGGVPSGSYRIAVMRRGELQGIPLPSVVDVPDAPTFPFDIDLPTGVLAGTVRDIETLEPLANVRVLAQRHDLPSTGDRLSDAMLGRAADTFTDRDGRFVLAHLPAGTFDVRAGGTDIAGLSTGSHAIRWYRGMTLRAGERREGLLVELEPSGSVEGRITDARGVPVAGVLVHFRGPGQPEFAYLAECVTDNAGYYRISGLAPGTWTLLPEHPDFPEAGERTVEIERGVATRLEIRLE